MKLKCHGNKVYWHGVQDSLTLLHTLSIEISFTKYIFPFGKNTILKLILVHSVAFQMGMFLLSSITESANEQLRPHFPSLFQLFSSTLEDKESKLVPFYTIR